MVYEGGRCNKTFNPKIVFIVTPSLEVWPTKPPTRHEVKLTLLDTNPEFPSLKNI